MPALLWILVFTIYPFLYSFYISVTDMNLLRMGQFVTGFALAYLFHKKRFLSGLGRTSVIMLLISFVLTLIYMFVFRGG